MGEKLKGKVAIVTGASRGIGRAISLSIAGEGATIALAARDKEALAGTSEAVEQAGGEGFVVPTELAEEASIKNLVEVTEQKYGRLDILVNSAGTHPHTGPLEHTRTEYWDQCMTINARGPFILCREAIPLLRKSGGGHIVNISSVVGVKGYPNQSEYTASKHALRGMSISLAEELRNDNIRVHVVCPGAVDTRLAQKVRPDINKDELMAPEEIAELVLYLVTHKGNAVIDDLHIRRATSSPWF